eukprot:13993537-Alexandrium_andersonii.AAC.1
MRPLLLVSGCRRSPTAAPRGGLSSQAPVVPPWALPSWACRLVLWSPPACRSAILSRQCCARGC